MANFKEAIPVLLKASDNAPLFVAMAESQCAIPMAVGIAKGILDTAAPEDQGEIRRAFRRMSRSGRYIKALIADGAMRHGLDGLPIEPVSDAHRAHAEKIRAERRAWHEARARENQAKKAPPPPKRPILKLADRSAQPRG